MNNSYFEFSKMSTSEDDFEELQLSVEAQKALQEFYNEQNEKLLVYSDDKKDVTNIKFDEDWVSCQFVLIIIIIFC